MQKKILALHDLSCLGRSSLVPIIGTLSAMGHQCVPLPTALYSSHLALPGWVGTDLTDTISPAIAQYEALEMRFHAVFSGYMSSARQIDLVADAVRRVGGDLFVVDPVMGDNGVVYKTFTAELCSKMGKLCHQADVITPNVTEAAILLGKDPAKKPETEAEVHEWAGKLYARYGAAVVMTGIELCPGEVAVACFENGACKLIRHARVGQYYPGTGDLFASVLVGGLVKGNDLVRAAGRAAGFVKACIEETEPTEADRRLGVEFESQLWRLVD